MEDSYSTCGQCDKSINTTDTALELHRLNHLMSRLVNLIEDMVE